MVCQVAKSGATTLGGSGEKPDQLGWTRGYEGQQGKVEHQANATMGTSTDTTGWTQERSSIVQGIQAAGRGPARPGANKGAESLAALPHSTKLASKSQRAARGAAPRPRRLLSVATGIVAPEQLGAVKKRSTPHPQEIAGWA